MAVSGVIGTKRDGTIKLTDGGPTNLTITLDVGDFAFDDGSKASRVVLRDRGAICGLRFGDDEVIALSFSAHFTEFTNSSANILLDFCYKRGNMDGGVSTGGSGYEPFLVTVTYTCDKTSLGDGVAAVAIFSKVLLIASFSEGESDTLSITGECYGGVTYTGVL